MKVVVMAWVVFVLAVLTGWVFNVMSLFAHGWDAGVTIEIALRIVGIFVVPLGALMGYFA